MLLLHTLLLSLSYSSSSVVVVFALPGPANTVTPTTTSSPPAATTTRPPVSLPLTCDYSYCDGSSSWCFYWAGITSYDVSRGPVPGETRVGLGPCGVTATTSRPAST
ncbi:hypothetical protein L249_8441 [Ophiocordyceps polyrhachis-furcata BCC 54312]|uniref:Secreted protein n=1 Tax=Ophiocordyceps polyrhachis-furcata BCC 54312 TaxID=1330021 RepID=A0A367L7B2_9HYPO|nr:hypothetical protein L249_8441 [Ophiocordyceps polyrhachis-furcata BCC 54312]